MSIDNLETLEISVANNVSAVLAYWDKNEVCRFANKAYGEWFNKTPADMIGKITIKELLGSLYEKNLPYIRGVLNGKAQTFEREIPTPEGGMRHSIANYFPDIVNGEVRGFFLHVADITPIKKLEQELKDSNAIITEQNKRLLNFANIVTLNLKSYANNLESLLLLYEKADSKKEKNDLLRYLRSISNGFSGTVNDLNEIVKVQNHNKAVLGTLNLFEYIEKAIEMLNSQIRDTKAIINNNVGSEILLLGNAVYLESILLNFISNAIKYRRPGHDPIIELDAVKKEKVVTLTIKDNGLGIDLQKFGNDLFGMYKTFHQNPDAQGIGLFIAKLQIESIGGNISVESVVNEGTSFHISFKSA